MDLEEAYEIIDGWSIDPDLNTIKKTPAALKFLINFNPDNKKKGIIRHEIVIETKEDIIDEFFDFFVAKSMIGFISGDLYEEDLEKLSDEEYYEFMGVFVNHFDFFENLGEKIPDKFFEIENVKRIYKNNLSDIKEEILFEMLLRAKDEIQKQQIINLIDYKKRKNSLSISEGKISKQELKLLEELNELIPKLGNLSLKNTISIFLEKYARGEDDEAKNKLRLILTKFYELFEKILKIKAKNLSDYEQRSKDIFYMIRNKKFKFSNYYSERTKSYLSNLKSLAIDNAHPELNLNYELSLSLNCIYNLVKILFDYGKWNEGDKNASLQPLKTRML